MYLALKKKVISGGTFLILFEYSQCTGRLAGGFLQLLKILSALPYGPAGDGDVMCSQQRARSRAAMAGSCGSTSAPSAAGLHGSVPQTPSPGGHSSPHTCVGFYTE